MLSNTTQTYGLVAQLLHWATALLILTLIPLGIYMHDLPDSSAAEIAYKFWFYSLHKTLGITAFVFALCRVGWALSQRHPLPLNSERTLEVLAAKTVHWILYASIILLPLTGWLHHSATEGFAPIWLPLPQDLPMVPKSPALAAWFGAAHYWCGVLLVLSLVLHIAGALKHTFVDRDATLARMVPGQNPHLKDPDLSKHVGEPTGLAAGNARPILLAGAAFIAMGLFAAVLNILTKPSTMDHTAKSEVGLNTNIGWAINHEKSALAIRIVQSGKEIDGSFANWSANINFDPDNLVDSSIQANIDVSSLTLGSVSSQAIGPDFLNASAHPIASFVSQKITKVADGEYEAQGELSMAGQTKPFTLPYQLVIDGDRAHADGTISLERLAFGIGAKGHQDDKTVGYNVSIIIQIEADKITTEPDTDS